VEIMRRTVSPGKPRLKVCQNLSQPILGVVEDPHHSSYEGSINRRRRTYSKNTSRKRTGCVAQVIEHLNSKHETLT
jgi:hypothetical protein